MYTVSQSALVDTVIDALKDLGLDNRERSIVLNVIDDSLHRQEYCVDDKSLRSHIRKALAEREE